MGTATTTGIAAHALRLGDRIVVTNPRFGRVAVVVTHIALNGAGDFVVDAAATDRGYRTHVIVGADEKFEAVR